MIDILTHLQSYVPHITFNEQQQISTGEFVTEQKGKIHHIVLSGDQLTAARVRAAKRAKLNSETPLKRLEGLIPAVDDWHNKANFLGV
jgi:hypothetical protein